MTSELLYQFGNTDGGDETGFNDAVKTAFDRDIPITIARESIQNIIDARLDKSRPVLAELSLLSISANEIPQVEQLKKILQACKEYYPQNRNCVQFYERALTYLDTEKNINILKIADYNTTGLSGDDEDTEGNYYTFLKSVGASSKSGEKGGSFGLGKGSYFAASLFNTIYVSSLYGENKHIFQGKLRLVSHRLDGKVKQGNGSFGLLIIRDTSCFPKNKPLNSVTIDIR